MNSVKRTVSLQEKCCLRQLSRKDRLEWTTFEDILEHLHAEGIYIHSEQLAEFLLNHGLPVHLRYVPVHLQNKAIEINKNYQGDMVDLIEEPEPPNWDFSWMERVQLPVSQNQPTTCNNSIEKQEQPDWNYS